MKNPICEMLGVEFPLIAFSHCRDVIAAVSKAGGFGVLGATAFSPSALEEELKWIDDHIDGRPYGVDVLIPENLSIKGEKDVTIRSLAERIPQGHKDFVRNLLAKHDIDVEQAPQNRALSRIQRAVVAAGGSGVAAARGFFSPSN